MSPRTPSSPRVEAEPVCAEEEAVRRGLAVLHLVSGDDGVHVVEHAEHLPDAHVDPFLVRRGDEPDPHAGVAYGADEVGGPATATGFMSVG